MKATVTRTYRTSPDGYNIHTYQIGEVIDGPLAEEAVKCGYAKVIETHKPREPRKTLKLETK